MNIQNLYKQKISSTGVNITINNHNEIWSIRLANSNEIRNFLDDIESMAVIKPAYIVTAPYDTNVSENANFNFENRNFICRKIVNIYYQNTIIYKNFIIY